MLLTETSDTQALLHQYTMINLSDTDLLNQLVNTALHILNITYYTL